VNEGETKKRLDKEKRKGGEKRQKWGKEKVGRKRSIKIKSNDEKLLSRKRDGVSSGGC